jgi:hypothetical protein
MNDSLFFIPKTISKPMYTGIVLWVFLFTFTPVFGFAQIKNSSSFTQSIAQFNQASASERQQFIARMANESQSVIIPNSVDSLYRSEADKLGIPEPTYTKYKILLKMICNDNMHIVDRVNACNFVLLNYTDDQIPVNVFAKQKELFILNMEASKK